MYVYLLFTQVIKSFFGAGKVNMRLLSILHGLIIFSFFLEELHVLILHCTGSKGDQDGREVNMRLLSVLHGLIIFSLIIRGNMYRLSQNLSLTRSRLAFLMALGVRLSSLQDWSCGSYCKIHGERCKSPCCVWSG